MKLFKMDESLTSVKKPCIKIILSVIVLVVCFFRKKLLLTDNQSIHSIATAISLVLTVGCIYCIAVAMSECFYVMESKKTKEKVTNTPKDPIKVWTCEELFAFLQKEDIIELVIETDLGEKRVGVASDFGKEHYFDTDHYFDKCYYIESEEYTDINEFKERFSEFISNDTVKVWSAWLDSMELTI